MPTFKCVLLADDVKTKASFVERLLLYGFKKTDLNWLGVEFDTNRGRVGLNVMYSVRPAYFPADGAILMFSGSNYFENIIQAYHKVPTIIYANPKDLNLKPLKSQYIYDTSSKNKNYFSNEFEWLTSQMMEDVELKILPELAKFPAYIKEDKDIRLQLERDLAKAVLTPLPEDDGDW